MPTKITFLLLPHVNLLDLGEASQVFHEVKDQGLDIETNFCCSEANISTAIGLPLGTIDNYKKLKLKKVDC